MRELCHVTFVNDRVVPTGGAARYVWDTASHLAARGIRSTLLYDPASPLPEGVHDVFAEVFPLVDAERQIRDSGADVVYAHRLPTGASAADLLRSGIPAVRFFHDHQLFCLREHKYTALTRQACNRPVGLGCYPCLGFVGRQADAPYVKLRTVGALRREQEAHRGLARFVVGSGAMARELAANGFDAGKTDVIPLHAAPPGEADAPGERAGGLLFAGALTRGKGVDVLLRAMTLLAASVRLEIVGDGPQGEELRAMSRSLGLETRVRFAGEVPQADLSSRYRSAALLVLPTRAPETFGLVGVEAMSHGMPVVASDLGGVREWLDHGVTGIAVPPDDPRELAAAVTLLLERPALRARMGDAARRRHRERFLPDQHMHRLLQVLQAARGIA